MADENKNIGGQITPPVTEKEPDTVAVPKSLLEEVLANQKKLEESVISRDKEIERLTYAADKSRLGIWDQRNNGGQLIRKMAVGVWEIADTKGNVVPYIIRGWKTVVDEVNIEDNGGVRRLVEHQVIKLFLDQGSNPDGSDKEFKEVDIEYVQFYRRVKRLAGEVIKESRDENAEFRTLRFPDGRTVEMDIRFVNI